MKIHIVQKGETLWEIAQYYEVDFNDLQQANPQISSPDMIMPGMKIMIPSKSKKIVKETKKGKKEQKDYSIKPLQVKEDDHKEKVEMNISVPSLESMKLPVLQESGPGKIKQKEKIQEQFSQKSPMPETQAKYEVPFKQQPEFYPMPHHCCCCPCHQFSGYMNVPYPNYYAGRSLEPKYTGHLQGIYQYPANPVNENDPPLNSQRPTIPAYNHYKGEVGVPNFPYLGEEDKE